MEPLYNVYFGGETLPGEDPARVREQLARLFNANESTLDKLFNGRLHLLKRGCDRPTALKFKQAMESAGARPVIKPAGDADPATATDSPASTGRETSASAADRIAALAAAPDLEGYRTEAPAAKTESTSHSALDDEDSLLAPPESDVLRPEERAPIVHSDIDTSALEVAPPAEHLAPAPPPPPPAPDISHLSMGAVGDDIPTLERGDIPPLPDTDDLSLSPAGTDFSDCNTPEPERPEVDLSGLDLAPAGSDVLEEKYRDKPPPAAPSTEHIKLED